MDYCSNFDIITLKNLDKNMENRPSIKKKRPPPKKKRKFKSLEICTIIVPNLDMY